MDGRRLPLVRPTPSGWEFRQPKYRARGWRAGGRVLTFADLRPCRWNLFHRPASWFDMFTQIEGPPPNLTEWQAASAEIDARCA